MKTKAHRHGEIVLLEVSSLPKDLVETKTDIFGVGRTGNNHTFKGGKLYLKNEDQYITGYLEAKNTKLYHTEHSPKGVAIPDGVYELRKQSEWINGELKQVVD